jgi:hypothetical protein
LENKELWLLRLDTIRIKEFVDTSRKTGTIFINRLDNNYYNIIINNEFSKE